MTNDEFKKLITEGIDRTPWDLGNAVIYKLCQEYPGHKTDEEILAKIWIIGRSYAAAIERRRINNHINDDFYTHIVAPGIRNSSIDQRLNGLLVDGSFNNILTTHYWLTQLFRDMTGMDKRSLASKYLHFHFPDLFHIYDQRASSTLNKLITGQVIKFFKINKKEMMAPGDELGKLKPARFDKEYSKFFLQAKAVVEKMKKDYDIELTPRKLDNLLIELANGSLRN